MKKIVYFVLVFSTMAVFQAYGQHRVNDIKQYQGWYKINVETGPGDNVLYNITQCYPNGDEYVLNSSERQQLPLYIKVFCIAISEEILKEQMESMTFDEGGIFMRVIGFTFMMDFSKTEDEILESLGKEMVNTYKNKNW
ncbi:MAG: hypothetical protein LBL20_00255 [Treponema sp.]|jgi:hypothetical protein|nr:hypothetical protein [Treponema sp.]